LAGKDDTESTPRSYFVIQMHPEKNLRNGEFWETASTSKNNSEKRLQRFESLAHVEIF